MRAQAAVFPKAIQRRTQTNKMKSTQNEEREKIQQIVTKKRLESIYEKYKSFEIHIFAFDLISRLLFVLFFVSPHRQVVDRK